MIVNLYVPDVAAEAAFFTDIGFAEIARIDLGGYESVVVAPDANGNARLQLFDLEFIQAVSPEVADSKPSMLFAVDDLSVFHEAVAAHGLFTSPIQDLGDRHVFNFQSPSGMYFAASEDKPTT